MPWAPSGPATAPGREITFPALDLLDGRRLTNVRLPVQRVVGLTCGCGRVEATRPDGSAVHMLSPLAGA